MNPTSLSPTKLESQKQGINVFRGRFEHSLDEKGRLAIPSRYRDILTGGADQGTIILTNLDACLVGYSEATWRELEERFAKLPQFDPKVIAFQRYFFSGANECPIDKAGRILIPPCLRKFAEIEKDCIIAGQLSKFEIWSANRWERMFCQITDQFQGIIESISKMGLEL